MNKIELLRETLVQIFDMAEEYDIWMVDNPAVLFEDWVVPKHLFPLLSGQLKEGQGELNDEEWLAWLVYVFTTVTDLADKSDMWGTLIDLDHDVVSLAKLHSLLHVVSEIQRELGLSENVLSGDA